MGLKSIFAKSGIPEIGRGICKKIGSFSVVFHGVVDDRVDIPIIEQGHISTSQFDLSLKWLSEHFKFITTQELLDGVKGGVHVSFDDGYLNNFTNALPILEKYDAPAIIFLTKKHIVNPSDWLWFNDLKSTYHFRSKPDVPVRIASEIYDGMTEEQVIELSNHPLVELGAHTVSHPNLSHCTIERAEEEILNSKHWIESLIQKEVEYFAYPNSDYNNDTLDIVRKNFDAGFSVMATSKRPDRFEIPRVDLYKGESSYMNVKMSGLFRVPYIHRK